MTDSTEGKTPDEFLKNNSLSKFAWLDRILRRFRASQKLALLLAQAESSWDVGTVLIISAVLGS